VDGMDADTALLQQKKGKQIEDSVDGNEPQMLIFF
jgi:hypothetical protein